MGEEGNPNDAFCNGSLPNRGTQSRHVKDTYNLLAGFVFATELEAACRVWPNDPTKMDCVATGKVPGGKGADWGKWYPLAIDIPAGYKVERVQFEMKGYHDCNTEGYGPGEKTMAATTPGYLPIDTIRSGNKEGKGHWAHCRQYLDTSTKYGWEFQFQGWTHEEKNLIANSKGVGVEISNIPDTIVQTATLTVICGKK
jgi:hypothetical protein